MAPTVIVNANTLVPRPQFSYYIVHFIKGQCILMKENDIAN